MSFLGGQFAEEVITGIQSCPAIAVEEQWDDSAVPEAEAPVASSTIFQPKPPFWCNRDGQCQAISDFLRVQSREVCLGVGDEPFADEHMERDLIDGARLFVVPFGFSQSQIGMELLNELSSIVRDLTECSDFLRSIGEIFRRWR